MQRKNYLLKYTLKKSRSGMAMIMAVAIIVIIATIMSLSLSMTSETTKRTTDLYLYEQAILLSQSSAEYALLKISQTNPCTLNDFNVTAPAPLDYYNIELKFNYVYNDTSPCTTATPYPGVALVSDKTNGTVLMDITVSTDAGTEPITYFRRSIQKL